MKLNRKIHYLGRFASETDAAATARAFRLAHMTHTVEERSVRMEA